MEDKDVRPGVLVKLAPGVEAPENMDGAVDEGVIVTATAYGHVVVSFPGAGVSHYEPEDLVERRP